MTPENDPDGVDEAESAELHENTRSSEEGVERSPSSASADGRRKPATGLIGAGRAVDPRYVAQR